MGKFMCTSRAVLNMLKQPLCFIVLQHYSLQHCSIMSMAIFSTMMLLLFLYDIHVLQNCKNIYRYLSIYLLSIHFYHVYTTLSACPVNTVKG